MLVFSIKWTKRKLFLWGTVIFFIAALCFFLFANNNSGTVKACQNTKYNTKASNDSERIEFLKQFGWEAESNPMEICEIKIPSEFNDTYKRYNDIQTGQGFNLLKYKGKDCTRWTYNITNYPDKSQGVRANVLVLEGNVIGGDISSLELGGFMHGFKR